MWDLKGLFVILPLFFWFTISLYCTFA